MARLNLAPPPGPKTHEGAPAIPNTTPLIALRRSVCACLLWEDGFYEDGQSIAERIARLAQQVRIEDLAALAIEARHVHHLRHVPLLLLAALIKRGSGNPLVAETITKVVARADEPGELLALYWKDGKRPLSGQLKKGLAKALQQFSPYQLAKYNRDTAIKLRDVLFLSHAKPQDEAQAATWKLLANDELPAPDTWEVALSAGQDKKATWERLLREGQLGYLALLRNLRNMAQVGVNDDLVRSSILARKGADRVLPFRYVAAARACPQYEAVLDEALSATIDGMPPLAGRTIVLVDVSGSMGGKLSAKSDLSRMDAAATLASIVPGVVRVFTFSNHVQEVPPRRGMAGVDAVIRSQSHQGTYLGSALQQINQVPHDRLIVVTDEESQEAVGAPTAERAYMVNVATSEHGVGFGSQWVRLSGFSEGILRFIAEHEKTPSE